MSTRNPFDPDEQIIDDGTPPRRPSVRVVDVPPPPRRPRWTKWIVLAGILFVILLSRAAGVYIEVLWFDSLGYASVYWYEFRFRLALFAIFFVLTTLILRGAFWLMERAFSDSALRTFHIMVNDQRVPVSPGRFLRPAAWVVSLLVGLFSGLGMNGAWQTFALYFNQPATESVDPIFQKPLGFYLFTLPLYQAVSSWLFFLALLILAGAIGYTILTLPRQTGAGAGATRKRSYLAISLALAGFLLLLAWQTWLGRYSYLFNDHQVFSGVTYMEANYLLPGLVVVVGALVVAALLVLANAFVWRSLRLPAIAIGLPIAVYVIAGIIIPAYVTTFIVRPNQLDRESPYIAHNMEWTRQAYGLNQVESRDYPAEPQVAALNVEANRTTFDNIRLWDWRALQDTLQQIQAIRIYYNFADVDVDRYVVGGQLRQVMVAARELDVQRLPEASRNNWVNERLIYTHGYGVTMNTANDFTPEGMPRFILSNMPVESSAPEIRVTRPQIYFGQQTNTDVYVMTRQQEFDFPQGDRDTFTRYEGTGGIPIGGFFRRWLLAWALGDLSKLPFSDDVTAESRVLMRRNIIERVRSLAPFLVYDEDPYVVVGDDGHLYWMIDAFTRTDSYPYSRHYTAAGQRVNYIRNSVKVVIDAYDGSAHFYVFEPDDPIIKAYRAMFPALFREREEMPAHLRAHIRYPETLITTQAEVYALYHAQNPRVFFQREDLWSVARRVVAEGQRQEASPLEPYFVLMQLPGEEATEFVEIVPFTPNNRANMIGWMAGRSDGENYGSLLVNRFPSSRLVNGPEQIEARIDQNSFLSSQFTLWGQQGSRVRRGQLLVIPIGTGLLYVEPIYLQAARSPMPELRIVVLATQERLGYGSNFGEAMASLFADTARAQQQAAPAQEARPAQPPAEGAQPPAAPGQAAPAQTTQQLINQALEDYAAYRRLTAEGRLGEAGQRLESAMRAMEELQRRQGNQPSGQP